MTWPLYVACLNMMVAPASENPRIANCLVTLIDEAQIPAQEAGVLTALTVREGATVEAQDVLGTIDDSAARIQMQSAAAELAAAQEHAASDINVRFAKASADVAKAEYEKSREAARKVPGSVSEVELDRLKLTAHKAVLQIEQSEIDLRVAKFTRDAKKAALASTEDNVGKRSIRAPLDGTVVAVNRHAGEWVQSGEVVFRVVRLDRVRVEGWLQAAKVAPQEVHDRPVIVEVEVGRGQREPFDGKIIFVNPLLEAGGEYRVWAEVENRREEGQWLLRPGQLATMTVQVK